MRPTAAAGLRIICDYWFDSNQQYIQGGGRRAARDRERPTAGDHDQKKLRRVSCVYELGTIRWTL
jgi:hypothetical protein